MGSVESKRTLLEGRRRRLLFPRFTSGMADGAPREPTDLENLEAEIALLREENARLRLGRTQSPHPGRLVERVRALVEPRPDGVPRHIEEQGDEVWHILSEAMLVRNVLIDVCAEIGQVAVTLQSRLDSMIAHIDDVDDAEDDDGVQRRA